jgi:hypothetical protein
MVCRCTSLGGHNPWKTTWPRWQARGSWSPRFGSRFRLLLRRSPIWSDGPGFPYSFGSRFVRCLLDRAILTVSFKPPCGFDVSFKRVQAVAD